MTHHIYLENQKVLCYHGEFLYEAKVVKYHRDVQESLSSETQPEIQYLVHYNGWNKTWDEWVPSSRLMPLTEDNLVKQRTLFNKYEKKQHVVDKQKIKLKKKIPLTTINPEVSFSIVSNDNSQLPGSNSVNLGISNVDSHTSLHANSSFITSSRISSPEVELFPSASLSEKNIKRANKHSRFTNDPFSISTNKKARKLRYLTVSEEVYSQKCSIQVNIPTDLKLCLIDDHDLINRQQFLVSIPKRINVGDILDKFIEYTATKNTRFLGGSVEQFCFGVQEYFDISLGMELLYKFERPQYVQILSEFPNRLASKVYGFEHLLRLFVKLSDLLGYTKLDAESIQILEFHISEILSFLAECKSSFQGDYTPVTQEYVRRITYS